MSNTKQVVHAQLHDGFHIPGVGEFQKVLPPSNKTLANFRLDLTESGALFMSWTEGKYTKQYLIGAANVKIATLAPVLTPTDGK